MVHQTGTIEFRVGDETYSTWYIVSGDLTSRKHRPLVLLHGGPGFSHKYMTPHLDLYESHGIPVILYEQIGIGKSTHLPDKPPSFWTVNLFMDELDNVLNHFGVADDFDLLGHSWGAMLAANYAAARTPKGLHRLVLSSGIAHMPHYEQSTNMLLDRFPKEFKEMLRKHEREGTTSSQEYQDGVAKFAAKHICQIDPFPDVLNETFAAMTEDPTVYTTMLGSSEFDISGTLKTWSILDILHQINVPTLLTNGKDDEVQDLVVKPFFEKIAKVKWVQFEGAHIPVLEQPDRYFDLLVNFLEN